MTGGPHITVKVDNSTTEAALDIAYRYGSNNGSHHKEWVIDRMVRALTGEGYAAFVKACCDCEDGPDTYEWEVGIAP